MDLYEWPFKLLMVVMHPSLSPDISSSHTPHMYPHHVSPYVSPGCPHLCRITLCHVVLRVLFEYIYFLFHYVQHRGKHKMSVFTNYNIWTYLPRCGPTLLRSYEELAVMAWSGMAPLCIPKASRQWAGTKEEKVGINKEV